MAISISSAFAEHAASLRRHLRRLTRDADAAEDLVQDTFLRLHLEVEAGRSPDHPRAWLFRVGTNLATSRGRRRAVASRRAADLVPGGLAPSPEELLLDREATESLRRRLADLPPDARTALLLTAEGFRGAEIARRIGRSELATRSLVCRHRARLRAQARLTPAA